MVFAGEVSVACGGFAPGGVVMHFEGTAGGLRVSGVVDERFGGGGSWVVVDVVHLLLYFFSETVSGLQLVP